MLKSAGTAAIASLLCAVGTNAANHKGDTSLGPKVGYISKNKSVMAGLVFQHSFSDHFRLSPEISYAFRANDLDAFIIDVREAKPDFIRLQALRSTRGTCTPRPCPTMMWMCRPTPTDGA